MSWTAGDLQVTPDSNVCVQEVDIKTPRYERPGDKGTRPTPVQVKFVEERCWRGYRERTFAVSVDMMRSECRGEEDLSYWISVRRKG